MRTDSWCKCIGAWLPLVHGICEIKLYQRDQLVTFNDAATANVLLDGDQIHQVLVETMLTRKH